jgi:hypothetical protein
MSKYSIKQENEDGSVTWLSSDGKEYKSKAGAYKRSKKLEENKEPEKEIVEEKTEEKVTLDSPTWVDMEYDPIEEVSDVIPAPLKKLKPRGSSKGKPSKKQIEAEREVNEGVLTVLYRTSDMLLTKYKRSVLDDPKALAVTHSDEDYQWISGITQDALEYNGVNIAGALSPNTLAAGANAYWFSVPVYKIQKEADKSPFQGRFGSAIGRGLERLPFIGKRIKARRMRDIEAVREDSE